MSVFHAGNCVCEENNGCNECLPYFSLNPLPSSSCFFCPLHILDITILIAVVNMEAQWNTWSWWQLVLLTPSPLGNSTEPVQGKKMQELLKRRAIKASHGACTAEPVQSYLCRHRIYCLFCSWCGISENVNVYLVKWRGCKVLQSATPNHLACLFQTCSCCHL